MSTGIEAEIDRFRERNATLEQTLQTQLEVLNGGASSDEVEQLISMQGVAERVSQFYEANAERLARLETLDREGRLEEATNQIRLHSEEQNSEFDLLERQLGLIRQVREANVEHARMIAGLQREDEIQRRRDTIELVRLEDECYQVVRGGHFAEARQLVGLAARMQEVELGRRRGEAEVAILEAQVPVERIWDRPGPGMCIEGYCKNNRCAEYGKQLFLNRGFGTFRLGPEFINFECPSCSISLKDMEWIHFIKDGLNGYLSVRVIDGGVFGSDSVKDLFAPLFLNSSYMKAQLREQSRDDGDMDEITDLFSLSQDLSQEMIEEWREEANREPERPEDGMGLFAYRVNLSVFERCTVEVTFRSSDIKYYTAGCKVKRPHRSMQMLRWERV